MIQEYLIEFKPYIFLVAGLITLIISLLNKSNGVKLKETGIPVDGIIFEQGFDQSTNNSYDTSSSFVKDKISVRYVTLSGEWITEDIKQEFRLFYSGQYKDSETVKVYYEKDNPRNFYIDSKQSELGGRILGIVIGLGFTVYGLYEFFKL